MRIFSFFILLLCFLPGGKDPIDINFKNPGKPVITVKLPPAFNKLAGKGKITYEEGRKVLAIFVILGGKPAPSGVYGNYTASKSELSFVPESELAPGTGFEAQFYTENDTLKKRFVIPASAAPAIPPAEVVQIYPFANELPANILLFHVEFSQTMLDDINAYQRVKIFDSKGVEKPMVWRQKSYWEKDRKVLVLMIHPGRVKRGINYFAELGEIFLPGEEYTLVVGAGMQDAFMRPTTKEVVKKFRVVKDDRELPGIDYAAFRIPKANTRQALEIRFSEGMDYVSIITGIKIRDTLSNAFVTGGFFNMDNDSTWKFIPEKPWKKTTHEVQFTKYVSDFASNFLHRPFEITSLDSLNEDKMPVKWRFEPGEK
ncbi:MAG TPA: hypothetical protein VI731_01750 [Bacteroidia bacterium]|nr:hypothetical protein [Bacteroidia bacterium]